MPIQQLLLGGAGNPGPVDFLRFSAQVNDLVTMRFYLNNPSGVVTTAGTGPYGIYTVQQLYTTPAINITPGTVATLTIEHQTRASNTQTITHQPTAAEPYVDVTLDDIPPGGAVNLGILITIDLGPGAVEPVVYNGPFTGGNNAGNGVTGPTRGYYSTADGTIRFPYPLIFITNGFNVTDVALDAAGAWVRSNGTFLRVGGAGTFANWASPTPLGTDTSGMIYARVSAFTGTNPNGFGFAINTWYNTQSQPLWGKTWTGFPASGSFTLQFSTDPPGSNIVRSGTVNWTVSGASGGGGGDDG